MIEINFNYFLMGLFFAFVYFYINYPKPELLQFTENFNNINNKCINI